MSPFITAAPSTSSASSLPLLPFRVRESRTRVFGRRFEKEPIKLQKELEELQQEYNKAAETGRFPLSRSNSHYGTSTPTTAADAEATGDGEKEDALLTRTQSAPIEVLDVKEDASFHDDDREKKDK